MKELTCIVNGVSWSRQIGEIYTIEGQLGTKEAGLHITGDFSDTVLDAFKLAARHVKRCFFGQNTNIEDLSLHIHIPKPIDGPSCGLPIFLCLYSMLFDSPINQAFAFTGELTETIDLYPVGALEQKIATANCMGFKGIVFPLQHEHVVAPTKFLLCPISTILEAIPIALDLRA